jgi:hypothetical protein
MKIKDCNFSDFDDNFSDYDSNFSVDGSGNLYVNFGSNRLKISGARITEIRMPKIEVSPIYFHGQMVNTPIQGNNFIDISLKADMIENIGNVELSKFKLNPIWSNIFN